MSTHCCRRDGGTAARPWICLIRCNEEAERFEKMWQSSAEVESCVEALDTPSAQFAARECRALRNMFDPIWSRGRERRTKCRNVDTCRTPYVETLDHPFCAISCSRCATLVRSST